MGSFFALVCGIIISPLLILVLPFAFEKTRVIAPFLLLLVSLIVIVGDNKKLFALIVFIASGVLGYFGFMLLKQPFLVLLTGLFGIPFILDRKESVVEIKYEDYPIPARRAFLGGAVAFVSAFLLSLIPAVGPGHASIVTRSAIKRDEDFLITIGAIGGFDIIFSIVLLYTVGKSRIGLLELSSQVFTWDINLYLFTLCTVLLVSVLSLFIIMKFSGSIASIISRVKSKYIGFGVLLIISLSVIYFDGIIGLLFLTCAAAIGTFNNRSGAGMSNSMGALIVPTLILYFL